MVNPLVSVLICTFNAEGTIRNTLDSCLKQTYENFEILIHDDQSKDKTLKIIASFGDKRIKIIESGKKLGPYKGLNFLLDHAKGEYIAIQDHDDIWHPQKLEKQIDFLNRHSECVGCGTGLMHYYSNSMKGKIDRASTGRYVSSVFHTSFVFKNGKYRYDVNNDFYGDAYFLKKLNNYGKIYLLPDILLIHYIKPGYKNFSYNWFSFDYENIKRFWEVFPHNLHSVLCLINILIAKILPMSMKNYYQNLIEFLYIRPVNIRKLMDYSENIKRMMIYFV